jgi:hypothetical protein
MMTSCWPSWKAYDYADSGGHASLWLANCYFAHDSLGFPALLPFSDAPSGRSFHFIGTLARLFGPGHQEQHLEFLTAFLRTRRPRVRIPPGAPLLVNKTKAI